MSDLYSKLRISHNNEVRRKRYRLWPSSIYYKYILRKIVLDANRR